MTIYRNFDIFLDDIDTIRYGQYGLEISFGRYIVASLADLQDEKSTRPKFQGYDQDYRTRDCNFDLEIGLETNTILFVSFSICLPMHMSTPLAVCLTVLCRRGQKFSWCSVAIIY